MKKLLLFLSTLLLAFCSIQPANAQSTQERIFTEFMCSQINHPYCSYFSIDISLGYDDWGLSQYDKREMWDNTCKFLTKNNNSTLKSYKLGGSTRIVQIQDNYILKQGRGPIYTEIICLVPPPPPPKIPGCTDPTAINYNAQATEDNGTCQARIEGCTDPTAINYNANANAHVESMCVYPPPPPTGPDTITGYFEPTTVQSGATIWTMTLKTNVDNAEIDKYQIQTWDRFKINDYTVNGKDIILTMKQFDDDRLSVECNNYELTVPVSTITHNENGKTITNTKEIIGNFTVTGCNGNTPNNSNNSHPLNVGTGTLNFQQTYTPTMHTGAYYIRLMDIDENGNQHVNIGNLIFILGLSSFFLIVFFVLFGFIKNSFLGKSKKSFR